MASAAEEEDRADVLGDQDGRDAVPPCSAAATEEVPDDPSLDAFYHDVDVKPVLLSSYATAAGVVVLSDPPGGRKRRQTASLSPPAAEAMVEEGKPPALAYENSRRTFQKLWTDADEITILQAFLEFTAARGTTYANYQHDTGPFYDQIKGRLQLDFNKSQLVEKMRRLKKKYRNMAARMVADKAFAFRSPHDRATFEIASKIWNPTFKRPKTLPQDDRHGSTGLHSVPLRIGNLVAASAARTRDGGGALVSEDTGNSSRVSSEMLAGVGRPGRMPGGSGNNHAPLASAPSSVPNAAASQVEQKAKSCVAPLFKELLLRSFGNGVSKAANPPPSASSGGSRLDDKWKEQYIQEMEVYLKRIELLQEGIKLKLEELKSNGGSVGDRRSG